MQILPVLRFCCGRDCCAHRTGRAQQLRWGGGFLQGEAIDTPVAQHFEPPTGKTRHGKKTGTLERSSLNYPASPRDAAHSTTYPLPSHHPPPSWTRLGEAPPGSAGKKQRPPPAQRAGQDSAKEAEWPHRE